MEGLEQSYKNLCTTLETLNKALKYRLPVENDKILEDQLRDSRIQRFEYCLDTLWKFAKKYLERHHAIALNSPKSVLKALFKVKISSEAETETLLFMADMRNKTSHMYFEEIAEQLDDDIEDYYKLMKLVAGRMHEHLTTPHG